jgi:hypothetical protein
MSRQTDLLCAYLTRHASCIDKELNSSREIHEISVNG